MVLSTDVTQVLPELPSALQTLYSHVLGPGVRIVLVHYLVRSSKNKNKKREDSAK
jgi:hypothetical protein